MNVIIVRDIKNYLKNPIYWIGIAILIYGIFSSLSDYLSIHRFADDFNTDTFKKVAVTDADVYDGYVIVSKDEQIDRALESIKQIFIEDYDMNETEAEKAIQDVKNQNLSINDTVEYLKDKYDFYDGKAEFVYATKKKASVEELNQYVDHKLQEHSYAYYFSNKFADFTGLYIAFFATIILSFLFIRDTKKDTYELLHTKPVSAKSYVCGKFISGVAVVTIAVFLIGIVFSILCLRNELCDGFVDVIVNMARVMFLYIIPTVLMSVAVYVLVALLFKNPIPAIPIMLMYITYSNLGSKDSSGNYGFYGRVLGLLFRFEGAFFETSPVAMFKINQILILIVTCIFVMIGIIRWRRVRL